MLNAGPFNIGKN